jgi:16S rRNA (adenine1518-N6/adenine1519-N6)-dimethyltransferase
LRRSSKDFTVIEIDRELAQALRRHENACFHVLEGDVLERDLSQFPSPLTVVGNLPYNISTPLIFHLFQYHNQIDEMIFMLQKEVVDRMAATPFSKEYGRLSVMTRYFCEVNALFLVPPQAFSPIPKVDSMLVSLRPWKTSPYPTLSAEGFVRFSEIVRLAFNQRRKILKNALSSLHFNLPKSFAHQRAEELSVADFVKLTGLLYRT